MAYPQPRTLPESVSKKVRTTANPPPGPHQLQRLSQRVIALAESRLDAQRYAVIACDFEKDLGHWVLRLTVEGRGFRISLDECADLSRQLEPDIDALPELAAFQYNLELSSPGLFRPVQSPRELRFYVGWPVQWQLKPKFSSQALPKALVQGVHYMLSSEPEAGRVTLSLQKEASLAEAMEFCLADYPEVDLCLAPPVPGVTEPDLDDAELAGDAECP